MRAVGRLVGTVGVLLLAACASMPPQKLVTDIRNVSGKWEGRNEFWNPLLMTMKEDGTFSVMITVPGGSQVERKGRARLENGELLYDAELSSGKLTLHEGDNRRVLAMHGPINQ